MSRALTLEELADGAALALGADGAPVDAFATVDLTRETSEAVVHAAARAAAATSRVLVGLAPGGVSGGLAPVADALCFTLTGARHEGPPSTVGVTDLDATVVRLAAQVASAPRAATTLVELLRLTSRLGLEDGLVAESLAYSALLAGAEFAAWRSQRPRREPPPPTGPPVLVERTNAALTVTLNRPERRNAYSRDVRDALVDALDIAVLDPSVTDLRLRGNGPSFCSGGDLDEFGTTRDVVTAHRIRLARSAGSRLARCAERATAELHGACVGAGIEIPAFAATVLAHPAAWFQLPELAMGLVPGAGGTVSIPRRTGRWRTAYLVVSGERLEVDAALRWGLVDRVSPAGR